MIKDACGILAMNIPVIYDFHEWLFCFGYFYKPFFILHLGKGKSCHRGFNGELIFPQNEMNGITNSNYPIGINDFDKII